MFNYHQDIPLDGVPAAPTYPQANQTYDMMEHPYTYGKDIPWSQEK